MKAQTEVQLRPPLHVVPAPDERPRRLPNRVAYALAATEIALCLFASITPDPVPGR